MKASSKPGYRQPDTYDLRTSIGRIVEPFRARMIRCTVLGRSGCSGGDEGATRDNHSPVVFVVTSSGMKIDVLGVAGCDCEVVTVGWVRATGRQER
jgi:hypothetical protein